MQRHPWAVDVPGQSVAGQGYGYWGKKAVACVRDLPGVGQEFRDEALGRYKLVEGVLRLDV